LKKGLYHFSPKTHELSILWDRKFSEEDVVGLFGYPWTKNASAFIILTAIFKRQKKKYGERAYRCTLLEAGHIGQNIYLSCADEGVGCCSLSSANDRKLEKLIGIDGVTESVVYAIAIF
jgi:SagB-type dehydrogenase family enzyme